MRESIITEIRRIAQANGNEPPGQGLFVTETGIPAHKWRGKYWARWGDALIEAGFKPREWAERLDSDRLLRSYASITLQTGRVPTDSELSILRHDDPSVPSPKTLRFHFKGRDELLIALRTLASHDENFAKLVHILPEAAPVQPRQTARMKDGSVYLLKSGTFYKIGRSDNIERRVKEIKTALPDRAELMHAIMTDDPVGIEAYWHRRFADKRANGEWFKLTPEDVKAFQRRRFQ